MEWNRRRDTLLNGLLGALLGLVIARLLGREDTTRVAVLTGAVIALINWLGYEKPDALQAPDA